MGYCVTQIIRSSHSKGNSVWSVVTIIGLCFHTRLSLHTVCIMCQQTVFIDLIPSIESLH